MGQAILMKDGINENTKVNAQTLQASYVNGVLADALEINLTTPFHGINRPHVVNQTTLNIPGTLNKGVREVFFSSADSGIVQITGETIAGTPLVWHATFNTSSGTTTFSDWIPIIQVLTPFVGTDGSANGAQGLVPAPTTNDAGKVLTSNGWGYVKYTMPVTSTVYNSNTGVTTVTYADGTTEELRVSDDNVTYTVVEKDSDGNVVRTYVTTVNQITGSFSVVTTEGDGEE